MSKLAGWVVFAVSAVFFGCFFVWPVWQTLAGAFLDADSHFTAAYVREIFRNTIYVEGLRNSLLLGLAGLGFSLLVALPLAWLADRFAFPGKKLLSALLLVPMVLPPFVGAIGIRQIFGQYGAFNAILTKLSILRPEETIDWLGRGRFWGIALLTAFSLYPILYLNITAALANVDPAMEEAAENLGCSGFRKFRRITLPLIMPGLFAGGVLVFIFAFTELGVPLVFDYYRVTSVQIFNGIKEIAPGNPFPFALAAVMLVSTAMLYALSKAFFGRTREAAAGKATTGRQEKIISWPRRWACSCLFAAVICTALLPHAAVILISLAGDWRHAILPEAWTLDHYKVALGHPLAIPSIANSLKYASLSTLLDLLLGTAIACVVVRTTLPCRWLLDTMAMVPLAVPGLVLAFGYIAMTQRGVLAFLNPVNDPTILLIAAYAVRRLPYVVRSASAGLQQTSVTLEEAARNLGASPFSVLRRITLPLVMANLLAGGLLAFSFAMLEVSDSLVLAQKQQFFPITKAIYELLQLLGEGRFLASALGVWAMLFLGMTLLAASVLLGKRLGALFRV